MSQIFPVGTTQEILRIAGRHGVESVSVFGSLARGEAGPGSDVDPGHGFTDFMAFCAEAEAALGRRVDVVTEDGLSPYIRNRVLAEAIAL